MIDKDPPQAGDGATTEATVNAFNQAFNRHDVDGVMSLMTDDCLFENTLPRPDGERHIGQAAVRRFWDKFFGDSPRARFETEEIVVAGDRAIVRWRFDWGSGHVRGIDLFKVRDGKVAEKLSYVKG
ncbi:MAG: nuclear transport factor 2 family protein [Chloroflexi bacterium]|nr:MAG: nuclear transport factor 2 family protein [Chloroflexota bacterium]TMF76167.1 MAG: nuclear transport factor 2 family protein [Chloroflexota bacterium]TMF95955.1 MAG: nuclear transport factor 2 family protein [Chloroflexota bacterium]TMG45240.1 MAG: nuclear transport factor 2 family protein [Chloroflexota bacterium]